MIKVNKIAYDNFDNIIEQVGDFDNIIKSKRQRIYQQLKLEEGTLASEVYKIIEVEEDLGIELYDWLVIYNEYINVLELFQEFEFAQIGRSHKYKEGNINEKGLNQYDGEFKDYTYGKAQIQHQLETIKNNSEFSIKWLEKHANKNL